VQIEQRQYLRHLRRAAHVGRQDNALESPRVALLIGSTVVHPRSLERDRSGSQEDLTLSSVAVANHQSASLLIPLFSGRLDVVSNLGFESFGEHPPGSGSGDLVEIEQESFVLAPNLMYPLHRCTPSCRRANVGSPFDCSKGRYTTLKRRSSIHNFRSYLQPIEAESSLEMAAEGRARSEVAESRPHGRMLLKMYEYCVGGGHARGGGRSTRRLRVRETSFLRQAHSSPEEVRRVFLYPTQKRTESPQAPPVPNTLLVLQ
jgi:hypothetical protein